MSAPATHDPAAPVRRESRHYATVVAVFCGLLLISNVAAVKPIEIGSLIFDGGAILFPLTYVLGDVLARRTALTRAVQSVKPTGERDPRREAEIARRVADVVPELGQERVARIVDVIITESLDAAR